MERKGTENKKKHDGKKMLCIRERNSLKRVSCVIEHECQWLKTEMENVYQLSN